MTVSLAGNKRREMRNSLSSNQTRRAESQFLEHDLRLTAVPITPIRYLREFSVRAITTPNSIIPVGFAFLRFVNCCILHFLCPRFTKPTHYCIVAWDKSVFVFFRPAILKSGVWRPATIDTHFGRRVLCGFLCTCFCFCLESRFLVNSGQGLRCPPSSTSHTLILSSVICLYTNLILYRMLDFFHYSSSVGE